MSRILLLCFMFFAAFVFTATAQRTVSGNISDDNGEALPGVNVIIQGTTTGATTDLDGNYRLSVEEGSTLVFSFVGFETQEVEIGSRSVIDIVMSGVTELQEVVVTAQGIQKEAKSLGYAISKVDGEQLAQKSQGDIGRILMGKTAGMDVGATNGMSGSGTNIIIRGYTTISGSNQPLFVVDGVPFDGGTNEQDRFLDAMTESSRFLDLDPNNIENVSVLKGLSATILYGDRGRNGVILITTKNGSTGSVNKGLEVSVNQSMYWSKAIVPEYQRKYGGGFHQNYGYFFSNWGPGFNENIEHAAQFIGYDTDGTTLLQHPFNFINDQTLVAGFDDIAAEPYRYQNYDGVEDFFRTGKVSNLSVNVRGGNDAASYNMNFGRINDEGITPGNELTRSNFGLGGSAKLGNGITVNGTVNFALTDYASPTVAPSFGSGTGFNGGSVFGDLMYTPRSVDLTNIPFQAADGRSVYYRSGNDIQNPYWTVANSKATQDITRVYGQLGLQYDITDWLNVKYRFGIDEYAEANTYGQNRGGVDGNVLGIYRTIDVSNKIHDHTLLVTLQQDLNSSLNLQVILGATARKDTYRQEGVESTNQLAFGTLEHFNFVNHNTVNSFQNTNIADFEEQNRLGLYMDATLGYEDYLFLNLAARQDWTSTLESENNSIFYPGASVSFIPTAAFSGLQSNVLNYMKVRVGYGESAGFPNAAYRTRTTLALSSRAYNTGGEVVAANANNQRLGNANLKPERVGEIELGVDTRLFGRVGLNASVFKKTTTDLITTQTLDDATGFANTDVNAGELEVKGLEIEYDVDVLTAGDLSWKIDGNFTSIENTVTQLNADRILLTFGVIGFAANYAVEGEPFGVIQGSTVQRDENGNRVVGGDGLYIVDETLTSIGDPIPDFNTSLTNTLSWKGLTFSFNWQYRHGGDISSQTAGTLIGRGVVEDNDPINREATYIMPGVTEEGLPNTVAITATNLGFEIYGFSANEFEIWDGTTIRLNEVSLGYALPASILDSTPFGSFSVTLSGQNLWYKAVNMPHDVKFDTNSNGTGVGNGLGVDFISGPSSRRYGVTLKATF